MDAQSLPEPRAQPVSTYKLPECNFPITTSIRKQLASPSLLPPTPLPPAACYPVEKEKELFVDSLESSISYKKSTSISTLVSVSQSTCQHNCLNSRARNKYFYNSSNLETGGVNETEQSRANKSLTNQNKLLEQRNIFVV